MISTMRRLLLHDTCLGIACMLQKTIKQFGQEGRVLGVLSSGTDLLFEACREPQTCSCKHYG